MSVYGEWLAPLGVTFASFLLYALTLQPGLLGGDSAEAQVVPYVLGIFHYTGYPLYALLGNLWINLVQVGTIAYRMNLLSAVTSALAVGGTAWIGQRLSGSWLGGLVAASILACTGLFWEWGTRAGVRSLNATFFVAIIALAIYWAETARQEPGVGRRWVALWVVIGLSQAHHRTTLLMLPVLLIYLVWTRPALLRDVRAWLVAGLALLPGVLLYLYLPIRGAAHPPYAFEQIDSLDHFLDIALARGQTELMGAVPLPLVVERLGLLWAFLTAQFTVPGVLLGLSGIALLFHSHRREAALLLACAVIITGFTLTYDNEDFSVFYLIPVNIVISLGVGVILVEGARRIGGRGESRLRRAAGVALALVAAIFLGPQIVPTGLGLRPAAEPPLDAYRFELQEHQASRLTRPAGALSPRSMVVGEWEHMAAFRYSQLVDGAWQGAEFHYPVDETLPGLVKQAWKQGRQVYVTRTVPGLGKDYMLTMDGPLIQVLQHPVNTLPAGAVKAGRIFDGGIALAGYKISDAKLQPGQVLPLVIYWQAGKGIKDDYSISVRLLDAEGKIAAQADNDNPVLGSYPTSEWRRGSLIGDYYELPLTRQLSPGSYTLAVVVYVHEPDGTFRNLRTTDTGEELVRFAPVQIAAGP